MLAALCLLLTFLPASLQAAEAVSNDPWWSRDETVLTVSLLTATGLAMLVDASIRDEAQRTRRSSLDSVAEGVNTLGSPPATLAAAGLLYAWGRVGNDAERTETGKLAVQAVVAAEVTATALKYSLGRQRPGPGAEADAYHPFAFDDGYDGLPSGHTAGAFALAAVMARRTESSWSPYLWYGLASLVGVSRVYQDDHWASDVLAGALVGELAGQLTLRLADSAGPVVTLQPVPQGAFIEIGFHW